MRKQVLQMVCLFATLVMISFPSRLVSTPRTVEIITWGTVAQLPNGQKVVVCFNEGNICRIRVNIPDEPRPTLPDNPMALVCTDLSYLNIDDGNGGVIEDSERCTASYVIDFSYTFEDGAICYYRVTNN